MEKDFKYIKMGYPIFSRYKLVMNYKVKNHNVIQKNKDVFLSY